MSHYVMTEEQAHSLEKARQALSAVALLVDEAGTRPPPSTELSALLSLIGESIPEQFKFVAG